MPPDVIGGRYRVVRAIGEGGMGTVWLCRDETLRRDVAVKRVGMLPGESVTDSARAMREARTSAALSHRNVVTVFDVVEEAGAIWLVMEHVPSRSLADIIRQDGPLEPAVVADIGAQVADGLAAAHSAGTMHRDVKPGNVLVREDGIAKISDFGIARSAGDPALTGTGLLTGTPSYFSPELARGEPPAPPADVWALGATLYCAVEGRPPYPAQESPMAVLHDIAHRRPPAPKRADFLDPVLLRMLDRNSASRWTMDQARHALRRLAKEPAPTDTQVLGLPAPAPATTPAARPIPAPGKAPRRRRRYAALLVAVLLLTVAGTAYAFLRGDGDEARPSASSSSTRSPETPSPSGRSSSSTPSASGTHDRAAVASFLRRYFDAAPGGSSAAWSRLGPNERAQGRASYDEFWQGIRSVRVSDVRPVEGTSSVNVTLTYRTTDGRVSTERQRLDLIRSDEGGFLINDDAPVG